jgi:hypothetical protein
MTTGQEQYKQQRLRTRLLSPMDVHLVATYASSGTTWTATSDRRSHPGTVITTAGAGDYDVSGLPIGQNYVVVGCELLPPTGEILACQANVTAGSLDAAAGTLTVNTRDTADGALAAPANASELHLTLRVETGYTG